MKNEDYDKQTQLLNIFLQNSDIKTFNKMINVRPNDYNNITPENKRYNSFNQRQYYIHKHNPFASNIYNKISNSINSKIYKSITNNENEYNDEHNLVTPDEIGDYKLNFHDIIQDPEYKNKCMKGNYKWGSMKLMQIKSNLAKRKGLNIDEVKLPKIASFKEKGKMNRMILNGKMIINEGVKTESDDVNNNNIYKRNMIVKKYSGKIHSNHK